MEVTAQQQGRPGPEAARLREERCLIRKAPQECGKGREGRGERPALRIREAESLEKRHCLPEALHKTLMQQSRHNRIRRRRVVGLQRGPEARPVSTGCLPEPTGLRLPRRRGMRAKVRMRNPFRQGASPSTHHPREVVRVLPAAPAQPVARAAVALREKRVLRVIEKALQRVDAAEMLHQVAAVIEGRMNDRRGVLRRAGQGDRPLRHVLGQSREALINPQSRVARGKVIVPVQPQFGPCLQRQAHALARCIGVHQPRPQRPARHPAMGEFRLLVQVDQVADMRKRVADAVWLTHRLQRFLAQIREGAVLLQHQAGAQQDAQFVLAEFDRQEIGPPVDRQFQPLIEPDQPLGQRHHMRLADIQLRAHEPQVADAKAEQVADFRLDHVKAAQPHRPALHQRLAAEDAGKGAAARNLHRHGAAGIVGRV